MGDFNFFFLLLVWLEKSSRKCEAWKHEALKPTALSEIMQLNRLQGQLKKEKSQPSMCPLTF